jgi:serine/threonine protein kinase
MSFPDLKPENMLLTADNHIKLIDFGTAKEIGTGPSGELCVCLCSKPFAARTSSFCGTAEYLAPEILSSRQDNVAILWLATLIRLGLWVVGGRVGPRLRALPDAGGALPVPRQGSAAHLPADPSAQLCLPGGLSGGAPYVFMAAVCIADLVAGTWLNSC